MYVAPVTILCFLAYFRITGCENIRIAVEQQVDEEHSVLTLTCTTTQPAVLLNFVHTNAESSVNTIVATFVNCAVFKLNLEFLYNTSCDSDIRFTSVTKPQTRHYNGDGWKCSAINFITSSTVYTNVKVPIQEASISQDVPDTIFTNEGDHIKLLCEAPFGIPSANVFWFSDNSTPDAYDDDIKLFLGVNTVVMSNADRTYTVTSILTHVVSENEDGVSLYCNASNVDTQFEKSRTVQLNVRYKPATNIIINNNESYNDYYMIRNSSTIQSLQCDVRGGNPFATLTWSCYGGNQMNFNNTAGTTSIVTWTARTHDHSVCICKASHILGWSAEKKVYVHVLYPPSEPACVVGTATVSGGLVNVTLYSNFTMACTSDANPEHSTFVWIFPHGKAVKANELFLPSFQMDNEGTYNLYIENTMTPSIGDKIDGKRNDTFFLRVHYHPKEIKFHFDSKDGLMIHNSFIDVIKDDNVTLACVADGYPSPIYTWSNSKIGQLYQHSFTEDTEIICHTTNILFPTGYKTIEQKLISSAKLQVAVLYPPTYPVFFLSSCVNISFANGSSINVLLHETLRIHCYAGGNPSPAYFWSETVQSSELHISLVSRNYTSWYLCTVHNTMTASYGKSISSSMTSRFFLNILYPAKIINLNTTIEVLEGVNFSLTCDAKPGNPNITSYSWTSTQLPDRNTSGQYLIIQNISRTDEGIFTCSVQNTMHPTGCPPKIGRDIENVYVDVQYKASVKTFTAPKTTVYHGDELTFVCEVESDPPANIIISSPSGSTFTNTAGNNKLHYIKISSCLEDIGQFSCKSENKYNRNQPDRRLVKVDVKCSPLYPTDYNPITTIGIRPGRMAVCHFRVFSNPPPINFTWMNISNNMQIAIDTTTSDRVIINTTDDMSSAFIITSIEPWEYGNYSVRVDNEIGSMIETFRIVVDNNSEPGGETSKSDKAHGTVVGGTVGALVAVVSFAILIVIFFLRKRKHRQESERPSDGCSLKDDKRYEDLAIVYRGTPIEYSDLDFRCGTEISSVKTKTKDSDVYENLKLTSTESSSLT